VSVFDDMTPEQLKSHERTLTWGSWVIVAGAVSYSVLTVTPLVEAHTPDGWKGTAPLLPIVVDTAVVIVTRMDAALSRLGVPRKARDGGGGLWPAVLRWMTGLMTLALNVGASLAERDWAGAAIHSVAPLLLIVSAEAGLAYRRALATGRRLQTERARAEQEAREARERAEREREHREREAEQERAERLERERREHEAKLAREEREHQARLERERLELERERDRAAREQAERERAERERRDREEREAREEAEREARQRAEQERQHHEALRQWLLDLPDAAEKLPEGQALDLVVKCFAVELSVRAAARVTGWSLGWVSARYQELRDSVPELPAAA
jgi:hypothetical protein